MQLSLPDIYTNLRTQIINIFEQNKHHYGYRRIHASLKNMDIIVSEKIVRRIMREENLRAKSIKMRKYCSYDGEISPAVPNVLERNFKADKINEKWVTDVGIPSSQR